MPRAVPTHTTQFSPDQVELIKRTIAGGRAVSWPAKCRLCGERVPNPCDKWLGLERLKTAPQPGWPRLDPIALEPDAFKQHNIKEPPDKGRLPAKPEALHGRSSMGWTLE